MHGRCTALLDLGERLFLDGGDYDVPTPRPGGVEHKHRKAAVTSDQT